MFPTYVRAWWCSVIYLPLPDANVTSHVHKRTKTQTNVHKCNLNCVSTDTICVCCRMR